MQPQNTENNNEQLLSPLSGEQARAINTPDPSEPSSSDNTPLGEPPHKKKKARNWKRDFIILAVANIATIILPMLLLSTAPLLGLIFMLAFGLLQVVGIGVAVLNMLTISLYLVKERPGIGVAIFGGIVVILSAFYVSTFALSLYSTPKQNTDQSTSSSSSTVSSSYTPIAKDEALTLINSCQVTSIFRKDQVILSTKHDPNSQNPYDYQRYANDSDFNDIKQAAEAASKKCGTIDIVDLPALDSQKPVDITVAEATDLLNSCKLIGFYYDEPTLGPDSEFGAENSSTGIVLGYQNDPLHIHIANRMVSTMVPIARAAQEKCPRLQFWHDGKYE